MVTISDYESRRSLAVNLEEFKMKFFSFNIDKPLLYYKGGEFVCNQTWSHKPMFHQGDFELIVGLSGQLHLTIESDAITIEPHDVLLIPPYTHFKGTSPSQNIDFYWLHFFVQSTFNSFEADEDQTIKAFTSKSTPDKTVLLPTFFKLDDYEPIAVLLHQILSVTVRPPSVDTRDFLVSALLIQISQSYLSQLHPFGESNRINSLKEWIRANMSSSLTVAKIADQAHLNVDYLTRLFKKYEGITTLQYLNQLKIDVAMLLLTRTEMSIKEIAENAYFTDPKIFMHRFKSQTGVSPTQYRNTYNTIHLNNPHVDPQIPLPKQLSDSIDPVAENGNENERI